MKSITLNIGGQERIFYFGLGFLGNLLEKENLSLQELGKETQKNPYKWTPLIMLYSLEWGYERIGEKSGITLIQISEWLDDCGGTEGEIANVFSENLINSLTKNVPTQPEVKKKVMKK
jgi:hypothetical protein